MTPKAILPENWMKRFAEYISRLCRACETADPLDLLRAHAQASRVQDDIVQAYVTLWRPEPGEIIVPAMSPCMQPGCETSAQCSVLMRNSKGLVYYCVFPVCREHYHILKGELEKKLNDSEDGPWIGEVERG